MIPSKIRPTHLSRRAIVYLRQSTLRQVHEHRESTARQYGLSDRARDLGWPETSIEVIDEDLGQSGTGTEWRVGFQRLAEQVGLGKVGALLALEISRFARSSADWHHLIDLCGLTDVLIIDEQGIYDPRDPNDRLLLGLKGQMSEAEKYWMRLRMHGAKLSKARRGELRLVPPTGYVWDAATGRLEFDPDEQVQRAVRLLFERFRVEGSAFGALKWFIRNGLKFPARGISDTDVRWVLPQPRTVQDMLHSPIYTGAYVYGRRESRMILIDGKARRMKVSRLPRDEWRVFLPDRHPAYISWEDFVSNQEKLRANRATMRVPKEHRVALNGEALLQGIVLCGKCGGRMAVQYAGSDRHPRYICRYPLMHGLSASACWSVVAGAIDAAVERAFLDAAQPAELELALAVANEAERQGSEIEKQWSLRLERARYDAALAERRYKAVDPENRVVARTLESQWEARLRAVDEIERDYERARRVRKVVLSDEDRARILALARDLPGVWRASTTTWQQRKNLLRILVREVVLTPVDVPDRQTSVRILWDGDHVTEIAVERPRASNGRASRRAEREIERLVAEGLYDDDIAAALNEMQLLTGHRRPWDLAAVRRVRCRLEAARPAATPAGPVPDVRGDGLYSAKGVANRLGVTMPIVRHWIRSGLLRAVEGGGRGRPAWYRLDPQTLEELEQIVKQRSNRAGGGAS